MVVVVVAAIKTQLQFTAITCSSLFTTDTLGQYSNSNQQEHTSCCIISYMSCEVTTCVWVINIYASLVRS